MSRLDAWSSGRITAKASTSFACIASRLFIAALRRSLFFTKVVLPRLRPRSFSFFLIAAAIPFLSFRTRGGGVGCRGGALTPAPVFPHVASPFRGAVRCVGYTGAGSGLALVMLRPGRRNAGSTIGRTRWRAGRGSNYQNGPDTPRRPGGFCPYSVLRHP
jgi:hypothetical protein